MGVHDYNTVDSSDISQLLLTLPRGVKVRITIGWAKSNICQFTYDMHPIKIKTLLHTAFSCRIFAAVFCIVG
jgi:hypothetical protein